MGPRYTPFPLCRARSRSVDGNKVKLHVTVPADEFERAIDDCVPEAGPRGAHPGLPSGQGAPAAARGPARDRHRARAGAARLAARVLRRRGQRARRRRDRAARDRDHRRPGRRRRRVRGGRRGASAGAARRLRRAPRRAAVRADRRRRVDQQVDRAARTLRRPRPTPTTRSSTTRTPRSTSPGRSAASRSKGSPRPTSSTASAPTWSCPSSTSSSAAPGRARSSSSARRSPNASASAPAKKASFRVLVKEAKHKVLPDLTDEWVDEASEFDTVDELRADIRKRLEVVQKLQAQMAVRDKVLEAVAELVPIEAPEVLVDERDAPAGRGSRAPAVAPEGDARAVPRRQPARSPQAFIDEVRDGRGAGRARRPGAARRRRAGSDRGDRRRGRRRDRCVSPSGSSRSPNRCGATSNEAGVLETVRSDLARGKALEFLVDHATVVDEEGNVIDLTIPEPSVTDSTNRRRRINRRPQSRRTQPDDPTKSTDERPEA